MSSPPVITSKINVFGVVLEHSVDGEQNLRLSDSHGHRELLGRRIKNSQASGPSGGKSLFGGLVSTEDPQFHKVLARVPQAHQ